MADAGQHGAGGQPDTASDEQLLAQIRLGDEGAFNALVDRYHPALVRLATSFVGDYAAAEDVAQETWVGFLRGIGGFEGRSSLRTWLFRILTNRAKTRGTRDSRVVPFSSAWRLEDEPSEAGVPLDRFQSAHDDLNGYWVSAPQPWQELPEQRFLTLEMQGVINAAIEKLPPTQRSVITLRDIEGLGSQEVCNILEISESNQRVLLHRARSKVRSAIEAYLAQEQTV